MSSLLTQKQGSSSTHGHGSWPSAGKCGKLLTLFWTAWFSCLCSLWRPWFVGTEGAPSVLPVESILMSSTEIIVVVHRRWHDFTQLSTYNFLEHCSSECSVPTIAHGLWLPDHLIYFFKKFNWRIIAFYYCVGFCQTSFILMYLYNTV